MLPTDSLRIVVADDEAVIRMGLKAMLHSLGHKVISTARHGRDAIEKVTQFEPDLLLLDIKMPDMDGITAAQRLSTEYPLPIIMLTAYSQKSLVEKAVNACVMGYLVKPIDENKLGPTIALAVARYSDLNQTAETVDILKKQLTGRELIDKAKRLLIDQGMTEDEAYHALQADARKRQISLADMAQRVISKL